MAKIPKYRLFWWRVTHIPPRHWPVWAWLWPRLPLAVAVVVLIIIAMEAPR